MAPRKSTSAVWSLPFAETIASCWTICSAEVASSSAQDHQQLQAAHAEGDPRALLDLAHRIKGGARMVNARNLIIGCEQLEQACNEPVDRAVLDPGRARPSGRHAAPRSLPQHPAVSP